MSSELFETRQEDYRQIYADIKLKISDQLPRCSGEMQKTLTREINRKLEDANALIQEMEFEVQKAPPSYRTKMLSNIRTYKRDVEQLSNDLKRLLSAKGGEKRMAFRYSEDDEVERLENTQRTQLMQGTASLTRASDSLARSHQVAAETDEIGNQIIDELGTQRESLLRTKSRLTETDENLSRSRKILNKMARSVLTNKLLLVIIILLELAILGGVLYWKISTKKK